MDTDLAAVARVVFERKPHKSTPIFWWLYHFEREGNDSIVFAWISYEMNNHGTEISTLSIPFQ